MKNKIGPLLLSGLMIGPILGSGVILLPPLAYGKLGTATLWSWIIIMALGAIFAMIFSKLSILYPGDGGMTIAIEKSIGKKLKLYASLLMISAVSFGPTAVMLTASDYLIKLSIFEFISPVLIALGLVLLCFLLLLKDIKFISTLSFILSSAIAVILMVSSAVVLINTPIEIAPIQSVDPTSLGQVVLLLFWAIIGWEIVGNYSEQVRDLEKTIPKATAISLIVITVTYITISLAIQAFPYSDSLSLVQVLAPTFGSAAPALLAILVTGLCACTYLLIVGALARLVNSLAVEMYIPSVFKHKNKNGIPVTGVIYFISVHTIVLSLTHFKILDLELIVSIANGFFLANALIGLVASMKIIDGIGYKIGGAILAISLLVILSFSSMSIFIALAFVYGLAHIISMKNSRSVVAAELE